MAKIIKREWTTRGPLGKRVRHVAYGYTLMVNGQRERKVCSDWLNEADAHDALSRRLKEVDAGQLSRSKDGTLRELAEDYLKYKAETGKRSLHEDRRILFTRILPVLGDTLRVRRLTEAMIANYEKQRISVVSPYTVGNEMAIFKHMLRLGRKWGYLERVPDIDMPKKPEGRLRFLSEEEIGRLLQACAQLRDGGEPPDLKAIRNELLRLAMRLTRQGEQEDCQEMHHLASILTVLASAIDEGGKPLEDIAAILHDFAESHLLRGRTDGTGSTN